jgi:GntR family transcriptional regulator
MVADAIRAEIRAGNLKPGDKVPSVRDLAEQYKVAPMTVQNALRTLRAGGLIYVSPGRGTFVSSNPPEPAADPSPSFTAIMRQLDEVTGQLRDLSERVGGLEAAVFPAPPQEQPPHR